MQKHRFLLPIAAIAFVSSFVHAQVQVDVETPEQHTYEGRVDSQIRSWIHEQNKMATDEERTFIESHWRRAARIWRIRHLAEQAKDTATVARCETLLARADRILEEQIHHFRDRAPVMTVSPSALEVMVAPPPPQVEVQGTAPSPRHVWVPGFWQWNGSRHVWAGGHWVEPPQPNMKWEVPRWENRAGKWAFTEGRWDIGAHPAAPIVYEPPPPPTEVVVQMAPPAPIVEVRPAGPANGVWIPGYWHWTGTRHQWVGGRWSAPKVGMRWEPDHWEHNGTGYRMVHGRWAK